MLKILMIGIPLLCPSVGNDIVAGWKTSDEGSVCFCSQPCAEFTRKLCDINCAADMMPVADRPNTVRSGDRNIGSDPDANVRFQMQRDDNFRNGGGD
jgi:hypothetical protein